MKVPYVRFSREAKQSVVCKQCIKQRSMLCYCLPSYSCWRSRWGYLGYSRFDVDLATHSFETSILPIVRSHLSHTLQDTCAKLKVLATTLSIMTYMSFGHMRICPFCCCARQLHL